MKQKIFSLLVLMITTVCGAWAQGDFRVQLSVNCPGLNFANVLFYGNSELSESNLKGGMYISGNSNIKPRILADTGKEVEISQIGSPSYPPGFSYDGSDIFIMMSNDQKFTGPVNLPIDVYYNSVHYEGSVTVSVYHFTHSSTSTTWEKDATYHWHQCNYGYGMCYELSDGDSKVGKTTHTFSSGFCIDCGQPYPHEHSFSADWKQTSTHHFHPCTAYADCPLAFTHGFNDPMDDDGFLNAYEALSTAEKDYFAYGEHSDVDPEDGNCDDCSYVMTPAHTHTFSTTDWIITETHHFHPCTASADCPLASAHGLNNPTQNEDFFNAWQALDNPQLNAFNFANHYELSPEDGICDFCGYVMGGSEPVTAHGHTFETSWSYIPEGHYHKCTTSESDYQCIFNEQNGGYSVENLNKVADAGFADHNYDPESTNPDWCTICGYDKSGEAPVTEHVHSFSEDWYEMTVGEKGYHYKKCTADGCTINYENMSDFEKAITSYGQHQYGTSQEGEAYYTCKVCGKVNTDRQAIPHEHSYQWVSIASTDATADDPEHWQECVATEGACTAAKVEPDEKKHKFAEDATDYTYYTCSICGYIDEDRKAHAPHVHEFAEAWSNNETHHYHECIGAQGECTLKYDGTDNEALEKYGEHTYGASQEGAKYYTCQTCGYINTERKNAAHTHAYGDWQHDNVQHWKECTAADNGNELAGPCTEPKGSVGYHEYASTDNAATPEDDRALCSVCGWYNEARKTAIDNAASAAEVQSWSWDYEIPFNFEATVQNDRRFNADQCYTIFLPYALELNGLKAYTIEQHNDNILGFKEQAVTELPQLTPFVVKSETTGNPLSSAMTTVYATLLSADQADWMTADEKSALLPDRGYAAAQPSIHSTGGRLYMLGTLRYLVGNEANGRYIMQGKDAKHPNGVFKLISGTDVDNAGYDKVDNRACILPMRAHIETLGGDSREFLGVRLIKADGSVTTIDRLVLDPGDNTVYDLQGRRVQNPRKGSLYIIGGRKVMMK